MELRSSTVERALPDLGAVGVTNGGIPRVLHYVWLGGAPKPAWMEEVIANWRRLMPDFAVVEWNERNIDLGAHPWMQRMYAERRFAFASDYVRFQVLHRHGGVYLDTDVFMKKSIEPLLTGRCIWSFEFDSFLSTCFIASAPGHPLLKALMAEYDHLQGPVVNNALVTEYFLRHYPEFHLNNREQTVGGDIRILPKEYVVIPTNHRAQGFAVHNASNQWKQKGRIRPGRILRNVLGDVLFYKLLNVYMNYMSIYPVLDRERGRS